ncbi:hypothetical protein [Anaerosolibacter sp.]|uniref:hypothetical protein n=1 Tax=Anaerosolibacter sp. TaxID=1872527 RepID=UPI0039EF4376
MRIPREIYNYINFELLHYEEYKKQLEFERERILESSPAIDGQPRGTEISNSAQQKAIKLTDSMTIMYLERTIRSIDKALISLTNTHKELFDKWYIKGRKDLYSMCDELGISDRTFYRYRKEIIMLTGKELGLLKNLAETWQE